MARFIHTADWQLSKPYARVEDPGKRALLQQERLQVISRIGAAAQEHGAEFILVAGDLFDSSTASRAAVSAACQAIGRLGLPVLVIPGNHDHGGPGTIWEQPYFQTEQQALAPNLRVLLRPEPVELETAVIFPCPLLRRAEPQDLTAWLRSAEALTGAPAGKARIILAHGSTQDFGGQAEEDDQPSATANLIDLKLLPEGEYDYVALGDWHGAKQVGGKAWYSGTPELDRFPKGEQHEPGYVLAVTAQRGALPQVQRVATWRFGWHHLHFHFTADASLTALEQRLQTLTAGRVQEDLLRLELHGVLGLAACSQLETLLERLQARLLRLKLANQVAVAPTDEETDALVARTDDPLTAAVAAHLVQEARGTGEPAAVARLALRELFAATR